MENRFKSQVILKQFPSEAAALKHLTQTGTSTVANIIKPLR